MKYKFIATLLLMSTISGCSVYDSKRGELVSSTVQNIKLWGVAGKQIRLQNFKSPKNSNKTAQNNTFAIGGAFIPVSHTYVFDEIDRKNLRDSIVTSLINSGANLTKEKGKNTHSINIIFHELGMDDGPLGSTLCVIIADITSTKDTNTVTKKVKISANGRDVASAKNNAIKQLVSAISSVVDKNG